MTKSKKTEAKKTESATSLAVVFPIDKITGNPWNGKRSESQSLIDSIKANGLLQPIVVRQPAGKDKYQVIAGERRLKACKKLGYKQIACTLVEATDDEAKAMTLVENMERENLTPFEEADCIVALVKLHKGDRAEVAARLGRSVSFVHRREKLAALDMKLFEEETGGRNPQNVPLRVLEVLASLEPEMQKEVLNDFEALDSVNDLKDCIRNLSYSLEKAVFPRTACAACDRHTHGQPDLFGEVFEKDDRCLDEACYRRKEVEFVESVVENERRKHGEVCLVARRIPYDLNDEAKRLKVREVSDWAKHVECKRGPDAIRGVVWCGEDTGKALWFCERSKAKAAAEEEEGGGKEDTSHNGFEVFESFTDRFCQFVKEADIPKAKDENFTSFLLKWGCSMTERKDGESIYDAVRRASMPGRTIITSAYGAVKNEWLWEPAGQLPERFEEILEDGLYEKFAAQLNSCVLPAKAIAEKLLQKFYTEAKAEPPEEEEE